MTHQYFTTRKKFLSAIVPPPEHKEPPWWFAFQGEKLLVHLQDSAVRIPRLFDFTELGLTPVNQHYLGQLDGQHCYAVDLAEGIDLPTGMTVQGLRQIYGLVEEDLFWVAGRAVQIVAWDRTHQFCGRCGTRTITKPNERAKECPRCGLQNFPRLSPAIIVLVERDHQILLARSHRSTQMYSIIAGFVEPGETLEEAVAREVWEEVGITVKDIQYFGSQPWPFPNSLMLGFTAKYAGGEIRIDPTELADAGWFTPDNMPQIPNRISISRRLIDWYLTKHGKVID